VENDMSDPLDHLKAAIGSRYSIVDRIGIGGNGTVYLARDLRHSRQVAIKVMRDDLAESVSTARCGQAEFVGDAMREFCLAGAGVAGEQQRLPEGQFAIRWCREHGDHYS
jgi:serine/threonine-protein kinase